MNSVFSITHKHMLSQWHSDQRLATHPHTLACVGNCNLYTYSRLLFFSFLSIVSFASVKQVELAKQAWHVFLFKLPHAIIADWPVPSPCQISSKLHISVLHTCFFLFLLYNSTRLCGCCCCCWPGLSVSTENTIIMLYKRNLFFFLPSSKKRIQLILRE